MPAIEQDGTSAPAPGLPSSPTWSTSTAWPEGTRLICRREHPHPGAQLSLFDPSERLPAHLLHHQHQGAESPPSSYATGTCEGRGPGAQLEGLRAQEPSVRGLCRNEAWLAVSLVAGALLAWSTAHLLQRRARQSRAEDASLPRAACRSPACPTRPHTHRSASTRPGRGRATSPTPSHACGPPSHSCRVPAPDPKARSRGVTTDQNPSTPGPSRLRGGPAGPRSRKAPRESGAGGQPGPG